MDGLIEALYVLCCDASFVNSCAPCLYVQQPGWILDESEALKYFVFNSSALWKDQNV